MNKRVLEAACNYIAGERSCNNCEHNNTTRGAFKPCYICENGSHFRPKQKVNYANYADSKARTMVPVLFDEFSLQGIHKKCYKEFYIDNIIFSGRATIVFWSDGTKTVVKCAKGDKYDPEKAIAMAVTKKVFGNKCSYQYKIKKLIKKYKKEEK